ncbi:pyruvate kinase [Dethiosulfatarculus sandiegensis]|uniref:Pyruvate kinase n=1 Tax=Dethiosulfatarculus sandiegensis TaxID=1429043 RepID=A0A0D2JBN7_9BACT|nr:pyruvate kinase [Dethiosulfatarculus sandiegensis]KIX13196.1 pyruvate kinase [Dethiosulfatarculus sandiegensis]
MLRRTKIVATLGPATDSPEMIGKLIEAGLNVVRLNFSHGTHESHRQTIALVRRIAKEMNRTIGILQDLAGPKIRLGDLAQGELEVQNGDTMVLKAGEASDDPGIIPVGYPYLAEDVEKDERILLADGLVEILVKEIKDGLVYCEVIVGGKLSSHKGINLPSSNLRVPSFTGKDKKDLALGLELGVDFVALSFVRHEKDLIQVREILNQVENPPLLIAKIEKPQAVDRLPQILAQVDGAMVARGDLAVEMRLEEVPLIQKRIIRLARKEGKPVITATQMLRSMMENPRPTRAEATDVANAVLDGTDAVMLSDETAVGSFPVESVAMLDRIAHYTEGKMEDMDFEAQDTEVVPATEGSISRAACMLARELRAAAIVAATTSGSSARLVSRFRPKTAVIAITTSEEVQRQLALSWGVVPVLSPNYDNTDQMFEQAKKDALNWGLAKGGDRLVITAGVPVGVPGTTNLVKVMDMID